MAVLFAHGAKPWTAPLRLSELYDAPPDAVEPLRGALPELGLVLRDLAVTPDEAMPGEGGGKLALILLRHAHRGDVWDALEANLPLFADAVKRLGDSRAIGLIKYAMHVSDVPWERRLAEKVLPLLQPPTREVIVGYADRRFEEGVAVGNTLGRRDSVLQFYRRRFGALTPAHEAVILNADLPQLERLKDDLFTMNHPDELLTLKTQHES